MSKTPSVPDTPVTETVGGQPVSPVLVREIEAIEQARAARQQASERRSEAAERLPRPFARD